MPRHKDTNWNLPEGIPDGRGGHVHGWETIYVALLMDIRDELKQLNALLHCTNFIQIPVILRGIRRKIPTVKPATKRLKRKRKARQ